MDAIDEMKTAIEAIKNCLDIFEHHSSSMNELNLRLTLESVTLEPSAKIIKGSGAASSFLMRSSSVASSTFVKSIIFAFLT